MTVLKLVDGESIARQAGVMIGDCIVAVNGEGCRRFAMEYDEKEMEYLSGKYEELNEEQMKLKSKLLTGLDKSQHYCTILQKIKDIKGAADPEHPLILHLERHGWDSKAHSFGRFLATNDGNVVKAMGMLEQHEQWRKAFFPIDLRSSSLQQTIKLDAISQVCINVHAPTIYINYEKILHATTLDASTKKHLMLVDYAALKRIPTINDVVTTLIMYMEQTLANVPDPTKPNIFHFIDLTGLHVTMDLNVNVIKAIYDAVELNYPETVSKIVLFPISATLSKHRVSGIYTPTESFIIKSLLGKVSHQKTKGKYVITDSLDVVYQELGWDIRTIEEAGGMEIFVLQYSKAATECMILDLQESSSHHTPP